MNVEEQQTREQAVRDQLDYIIHDEHGHDGEASDWQLRVYGRRGSENEMRAPGAAHPNQTVLADRDGCLYLVTITMLHAPRARRTS